jgi:predicted amidohydrolase YtcJ
MLTPRAANWFCLTLLGLGLTSSSASAQDADLILHNGKVVTVDRGFTIRQALAVKDGRLISVGADADVLKERGPNTKVVDLGGKTVLPGLIDSHTHPTAASMIEFDHPIPEMETIQDVLDYVQARAKELGKGKGIVLSQIFITRLKEQRYPTRAELDRAAPDNPVAFKTGPDASLNTLALKQSGIDKNFTFDGPGKVEKDPKTGEPTGILRNLNRLVKVTSSDRKPTVEDEVSRLSALFHDYNANGLTSICDRDASETGIELYRRLLVTDQLTVRIGISKHVEASESLDKVLDAIKKVAVHPLRLGTPMLRLIGIKTFLDGGMLTGSAYMRSPWGVSQIYSIDDPAYRGVLFIPPEKLLPIVKATVEAGLQFTAHSVGDGAVHNLLDAYDAVNRSTPVVMTRPCITHSNFMSKEAVEQAARLSVVVDIQPAWLYLDTRTLVTQFGTDRLRYFQPLHSLFEAGVIAGGGSDHMQKVGSLRSINPYNPFLGMWVAITRKAKGYEGRLHPEEALTRAQAIRFYTINNAYLLFLDDEVGSLEKGKLADMVVLDRDILTCPEDEIRAIRPVATYLSGKAVFERNETR